MGHLTRGQLARRGPVNLETIRYYERRGLLPAPPRLPSGYRAYPPQAVVRLRFIKRAQKLGFTLAEIRELLELRVDPDRTCVDVRARTEAKIADVEARIRTLRKMKKALELLAAACRGRGPTSECPILEQLIDGGEL